MRVTTSKIRVDSLFADYRILSHSNNEITIDLPTNALSTALRSASAEYTGANEVVMKLAKKNGNPVLSFEIFGTTHMGRRVKVAHDVRIQVMKPADVALLTEPRCPEPDVRPPPSVPLVIVCTQKQPSPAVGPGHAPAPDEDARRRRTHARVLRRRRSPRQRVGLPPALRQHRSRQGGHHVE